MNLLYQKCDLDEAICNDDSLNEAYGFREKVQKHFTDTFKHRSS